MNELTSVLFPEELNRLNEKVNRIVDILETTDPILLDRIVNQHQHALIPDDLIRWSEDKGAFIIPYLGRFSRVTGEDVYDLYDSMDSAKYKLLRFILEVVHE
jgi:hypothetical protein